MRVEVRGLSKAYPDLQVLQQLDLQVAAGEAVSIQGASGTGKSTLLNCLGLLDQPDSGEIQIEEVLVQRLSRAARARIRAQQIGFIFQGFHLLPEFNALENILLAARCARQPVARWQGRAIHLLRELGLEQRAQANVQVLSGGERQRLALCRALLLRPALILADEPTGNLDPETATRVLTALLDMVHREGASLVLVTHDPDIAGRCDRQLHLYQGCLHSHAG